LLKIDLILAPQTILEIHNGLFNFTKI